LLLFTFTLISSSCAIKFHLPAETKPTPKCIWNTAHTNTLVVVSANVGAGNQQRTDVEIVDSSPQKNIYLNMTDVNGETRFAVTTHAEGEFGVCFKNFLLEQGAYRYSLVKGRWC
jgi:hypothetical protein